MSAYPTLYSALLGMRPAQLGHVMKCLLRVRRQRVRTQTGHLFWIDPVSILGLHLLRDGIHEEQLTKLVQLVLRPSDVFIDIGANEGYFSVIAASQVSNGAVHSIEPQTRLQCVLRKNFELNGSNSIVHRTAISDREGYLDMFLRPSTNTGASSMFRHWRLGSRSEQVACTTLDSFFREHSIRRARLIKIDCEGAEPFVISGSKAVLAERKIEFIAMDYHPKICGIDICWKTHAQLINAGFILTLVSGLCVYHLPSLEESLVPLGDLRVGSALPF